jgi:large subunit ribosomal protein L7/L12
VLEAVELAKALEEGWGISAAAAVAVEGKPLRSDFEVILPGDGEKLIQIIKEVRAITGLSLAEAKALIENAPKPLKAGLSRAEASEVKEKIEAAGGSAILETDAPSSELDLSEFVAELVAALHVKLLVEPDEHISRIRKILSPVMEG